MASNLTPMRKGKRRPSKQTRRAFKNGEPLPNLLRPRSKEKWHTRKNGKLVKLDQNTYAIQRTFSSGKEMRAYISTVRKLRQYCKTHPFEYAEFSPVYVKTVDAKGNRVLE